MLSSSMIDTVILNRGEWNGRILYQSSVNVSLWMKTSVKGTECYAYVRKEEKQPTLVLYVEEFTHLL